MSHAKSIPVTPQSPQPPGPVLSPSGQPPSNTWRWTVRGFLLIALGISLYLLQHALAGRGALPGCGAQTGFDCDSVLASRWASVGSLPTSAPAVSCYIILLGAINLLAHRWSRWAWAIMITLGIAILMAATWFIVLQLVILKAICPWCMGAHLAGAMAAGMILRRSPQPRRKWIALGVILTGSLIGTQLLLPSRTLRVQKWENSGNTAPERLAGAEGLRRRPGVPGKLARQLAGKRPGELPGEFPGELPGGEDRLVSLMGGQVMIRPHRFPMLGSPNAKHILIYLFDYTCPHCQALHAILEQTLTRYPGKLAYICMPMPLNSDCNPLVKKTELRHRHACSLAILALAVWKADPTRFKAFDHWLMKEKPTPQAARKQAIREVGEAALDQALASPAISRQLENDILIYKRCGQGVVPKLVGSETLIAGRPGSPQDLFEVLEEELHLTPVPPVHHQKP